MDILSINRAAIAQQAASSATPPDQAAQNRDIVQAVKALNSAELFGQENQLRFERDTETRRMVVKIVNRQTNEVVTQIPAEYLLRLAKDLKHFES